jgi:putative SOS response-associated peptidase YedK
MCFHNSLSVESQKLENRYNAAFLPLSGFKPVYHASAFSFPAWPVITGEHPDIIQVFSWGLIPFWTRDMQSAGEIRMMTLNARAETMHSRKSFSLPARSKRCLIPSTGFFEWQLQGKQKIPWFIYMKNNEIFSMAGLWDRWTDPANGIEYQTFSIVTSEAVGLMEEIHNTKKRMPLILERNEEKAWLESENNIRNSRSNSRAILNLMGHTVSPVIGSKNTNTNTPEVQKEYVYTINGKLF